jgi:hypothetical protein
VVERHRVRCIKKADGSTPDAWIARIGGTNEVGVNWRLTQVEAIQAIEGRRWDFYIELATGPPVEVIVATTATGAKYLKTTADGDEPSRLLALPEC